MKKHILTFLSILFFTQLLNAQLGIKAGLGLNSLYAQDEIIEDKQATLGFQGGLVFDVVMSERVSLQPELLYARRGASFTLSPTEIDARFDYIDFPVLLVFKPRLIQFLRLHAGPQISYLTDVEYEFRFADKESEIDENRDNYNEWDLGLAVGASVHLDELYLELRYTQGFRSVSKAREIFETGFGDDNLKNFGLQLSIGYFLK